MVLFGIGSNPLQIQIEIQPNQNSLQSKTIIPLDHSPSWRVSKNVFMSALSKQTLQNVIRKNNTAVMQVHPHQPVVAEPQFGGMPQQQQLQPIIYAHSETEDVQGVVHLMLPPGKHFEHAGIKIQFVGRIEMSHAIYEGKSHYDFISSTKELQPPTTLYQTSTTIPFYFRADDQKPYESYHGRNVAVKYFVRVIVERSNKFLMPPIKYDQEVVFQIVKQEPRLNQPIKMEVGIEECLHIEFQYKKRYYHLNDVIEGDIHFLLVRIKIKYMELAVIRRETSGEGLSASAVHAAGLTGATPDSSAGTVTETQTLTRFEIMDGAPVKGEIIPVRLYLSGIPADLTPTFDTPGSRFACMTMRKNLLGTIAEIFTHPRNFPKFASVVMLTSGMIGFGVMKVVDNKREVNVRQHDNLEQHHDRPMSQDESLVRAMIENAKSSTPMENLENAVTAQNNFMIPFHGEQDTKLFTRIKGKSKEIRKASEELTDDSK